MRRLLTLHDPAQARAFYEKGLWRDDTFYSLLARNAEARPDAEAIRDGRRRLTWRELRRLVDGMASDLAARGVIAGERVSIWMSSRIEAVVTLLACSREGFACNPSLHGTYTGAQIAQLLETLSSRALVTEPGWGAAGASAAHAFEGVASLAAVYTPETFPQPADRAQPPVANPEKVVYLAFTSGTTGAPKCVMHSDNTLLANARDLVRDWGHGPDAVILTLSPLSHHIAWVAVGQWLVSGCRLVTDDAPKGTSRLDWIVETGATYVLGVPTHAIDILAEAKARKLDRLGAVETFYMAGAPIPPSVADAFMRLRIKPQNVYGMTENSSHQYTHPSDDAATVVNTCGRGGAAYQVRLFDMEDEDRPASPGAIGQIGGRGAALMLGYFANQAATEKSFNRDGWFMSGDLGAMDEAGNLRIEGRLKDLIIRGGHNIYPAQIEALAMRMDAVAKVACFPVADERLGERVCIAVIGDVQPDDLLDHLASQGLSKYDMPEYFLSLDALPLSPSGKILKRELIEMHRRGEVAPLPIRYQSKGNAA